MWRTGSGEVAVRRPTAARVQSPTGGKRQEVPSPAGNDSDVSARRLRRTPSPQQKNNKIPGSQQQQVISASIPSVTPEPEEPEPASLPLGIAAAGSRLQMKTMPATKVLEAWKAAEYLLRQMDINVCLSRLCPVPLSLCLSLSHAHVGAGTRRHCSGRRIWSGGTLSWMQC